MFGLWFNNRTFNLTARHGWRLWTPSRPILKLLRHNVPFGFQRIVGRGCGGKEIELGVPKCPSGNGEEEKGVVGEIVGPLVEPLCERLPCGAHLCPGHRGKIVSGTFYKKMSSQGNNGKQPISSTLETRYKVPNTVIVLLWELFGIFYFNLDL